MHSQVSSCPHCGAPIYTETIWHGVIPPPSIYSCSCRLMVHPQHPPFLCNHCYCQMEGASTAGFGHKVCCKCGDRIASGLPYSCLWVTHTPVKTDTWISTGTSVGSQSAV